MFGFPHLTSPVRKEGRKKRSGRNRTQYEKEVVVVLGQFLKKGSHNVISTIVLFFIDLFGQMLLTCDIDE